MTATGSAPVTAKSTQAADLVTIPQLLTASCHSWLTPLPATLNPRTYLEQRPLPGHFMISYPPALYEGPNQQQTCGILPLTAALLQRQWQEYSVRVSYAQTFCTVEQGNGGTTMSFQDAYSNSITAVRGSIPQVCH